MNLAGAPRDQAATPGIPAARPGAMALAALCVTACCCVAILNGFPLVFSDTSTYLVSSWQLSVPWDRPIFYGLFLRPFLFAGLWPAVAAQSAIVVYLLWIVARIAWPDLGALRFTAIVVILCIISPLAWVTGKLLPDIFAAVAILGIFIVFFAERELGRSEAIFVWAVTSLAIATHLSYVPLVAGLIGICSLCRAWLLGRTHLSRRIAHASAALLVAVAAILASNLMQTGKPVLSQGSGLFALAKLMESGAAQAYLRQACPDAGFALCAAAEDLPRDANAFLWGEQSPVRRLAKSGSLLEEAREIAAKTVLTFPLRALEHSAGSAFEQFRSFSIGNGPVWDPKFLMLEGVDFDPRLREAALNSRQAKDALPFLQADLLTQAGLMFSLVAVASLLMIGVRRQTAALLVTVLAGVMVNAVVCGTLSVVDDRYQARVVWLFTFVGMLAAFEVSTMLRMGRLAHLSWPTPSERIPPVRLADQADRSANDD